jgi:predicted dehydrogenase
MKNTRIGIVGLGGMGRSHAAYLLKGEVPGATLAAVCDTSPDSLKWARANMPEGLHTFESADALFKSKSVDAVMIATPHYYHPTLAIQAMKHGVHTLVEKPAGVYTKQVREMNELAAKSDVVFGIMFNQRTIEAHQKMKDIVESGELGAIKRTNYVITDWLRTQAYYDSGGWRATWEGEGGGVLLNQSPHNLDLWQWICGMPTRVRAFCGFGQYHNIEVEDNVTAYVEYANGATGVFITSTGEAPGTNNFEIVGDYGKLVLSRTKSGIDLTFWRTRENVSEFVRTCPQGFGKPEVWRCELPAGGGEGHKGITKNWVNAIRNGTPLLAKGEEGINGVALANAMLLSAWTDKWIDLPIDDNLYHRKLKEQIKKSGGKKPVAKGKAKAMDFAGTY